ncbi:M1 family metallopeptidase [Streptomyces sp. H27-D2]|uniref:M1 family metallopeptidase n=1 Tax=Streptomyces sp. H27-D2 TaxID=3046304 RepID=UPI002DBA5E31|nr:M1 family metallopeptidase [Streptomyces sp. H27-D2]MEC4019690.1 M1 family metallopeptidase [Streptomyces sp. H27-D2]
MSPRLSRSYPLLAAAFLATVTSCTAPAPHDKSVKAAKPGAAGIGDRLFPTAGNGGYDVSHYGLTLDYSPEGNRLTGTAVITARSTQVLSRFNLDFAGLKVRSATVDGASAPIAREKNELTLTPARPIEDGKIFKVTVEYDGIPKAITDVDGTDGGWIETDDGSTALGEPTGSMTWFPGNHHPSDKATYDISVTVPNVYKAVSNGELTHQDIKGGHTTTRWHSAEPMASYVASVVVGSFDLSISETEDGLPIYIATDPDETEDAAGISELVPEVLDWASGLFGPYPFSSAGAVVDHLPDLGYALETQTKPYFYEAPDDTLVVHELAHQWFGNSVTPRAWGDMWLNEGFATYAEWMWEEKQGGRTTQETFDDFYDGSDDESPGIWDFPPASPPSAKVVSEASVYGRGAMTLHKVRKTVGDETFFAILKKWAAQHRHTNADTKQFTKLCEESTEKDLSDIFDAWLYGEGKPSAA